MDNAARRIWGFCPAPFTIEDLTTYLVGPVLGFVLRRAGVLALHASSFAIAGRAFALTGGAGSGKSTTAAALALRSNSILCEDITALREEEGQFYAVPGYPRINLWPDASAFLFPPERKLSLITPNWNKQFLSLNDPLLKFATEPLPLSGIYVMQAQTGGIAAPRIDDVSPRDRAIRLVQNTYMNYLLAKDQRAIEFDAVSRLVSRVPVKLLTTSRDPAKITALCELLETDAQAWLSASAHANGSS